MFEKILIANRGEIACRVMRTARRMGIRTVAVFSEADRGALHVEMADDAYPIGPAPSRASYLDGARVLDAARRSGAQAIHPGYGFLSENAAFAEDCAAAGLVFIGPPPAAIRAMGGKSAAKALMAHAGVPLVPGYHGEGQDPALLAAEAERIGYPVLIKASAGGGGKGMRVVTAPAAFAEALALAQGEARASFGDDQVLVERYLTAPRHIEIQVFADRHGNVVHLFERDCSIQRRHQKIIEEAPAPGMPLERRAAMGKAACDAARAIGYEGAGTVEFIAEGDAFFFMEMNTRLQVEHPVTEAITGQDLVEWQFRVAAGERLPLLQDALAIDGHAIEVRLYAEDPARDYRPSTGTLHHLRQPEARPGIRVDTGVRQGDVISVHYDPMIAKLITHGPTRAEALRRMGAALAEYEVAGVQTNLDLLRAVVASPGFAAGRFDTGYLGKHPELLGAEANGAPLAALALAAAALLERRGTAALAVAGLRADPHSPWAATSAWRLNGAGTQEVTLRDGEAATVLRCAPQPGGSLVVTEGESSVTVRLVAGAAWLDGVRAAAVVAGSGSALTVFLDGKTWPLAVVDRLAPAAGSGGGDERLVAPMPGRVVSVHTAVGASVAKGDVLLLLEAMKVQIRLAAPRDGTVAALRAQAGDLVEEGLELVTFEPLSPG
ncbi:MAG: acetyl/propionyl/methylcrotonyl-CoA carboxylase subunit alpha [Acetobacteraceae bacterium]|nr:acetyl/propionyl/methylcrotonyl-CoA carboxylase subunit alpha [Acetobacteraceae bacterium]